MKLMRRLAHPNIVKYLGGQEEPTKGLLYIFTECVLQTRRSRRAPFFFPSFASQYKMRDCVVMMSLCSSMAVFGRYVAGGSVDALLKQYGPLGSNVVARYAAETLAGLIYLHANGIVQCVLIPSYIQIAHIVYEFSHFIIIVSFTFFSYLSSLCLPLKTSVAT